MAKVIPITEQFQHFVSELKESFWGDLQGQVPPSLAAALEDRDRGRLRDRSGPPLQQGRIRVDDSTAQRVQRNCGLG